MYSNEEKMLGKVWWVGRVELKQSCFSDFKDHSFKRTITNQQNEERESLPNCKSKHWSTNSRDLISEVLETS